MKNINKNIAQFILVTILLIIFIWITFYSSSEDYSYNNFSPLEGQSIADEKAMELNESAKLIIVQKGESYEYRYGGNGEWSWRYFYVNSSNSSDYNYTIVTLYQNQTTSISFHEGDFNYYLTGLNKVQSSNIGITNWTIDCDEALRIIRANETFAEYNKKSPGLNIVDMQLTSPITYGNRHFNNPVWYIHFEGNYDDGMDSMYGTYGEAIIDATTGEVLWVNVNGEAHPIPCCVITVIILVLIQIVILIQAYKNFKLDKFYSNQTAPSRGLDEGQGPAQERKGGEP